jgi:hypothetical protein
MASGKKGNNCFHIDYLIYLNHREYFYSTVKLAAPTLPDINI